MTEAWANGRKAKTFVRAAGSQLAYQAAFASDTATQNNEVVIFEFADASGMTQRTSDKNGQWVATGDGGDGSPVELDPFGGNVGTQTPYVYPIVYQPEPEYPILQLWYEDAPYFIDGRRASIMLDGVAISWQVGIGLLANGGAVQCPNNYCGPQVATVNGQRVLTSPFTAYADGRSGYLVPQLGGTGANVVGEPRDNGTPRIVGWNFHEVTNYSVSWNISQPQTRREAAPMITRANIPEPGRWEGPVSPGQRQECDRIIASRFGNEDSVAATTREPNTHPTRKGADYAYHLADAGNIHIYGNAVATKTDAPLYIPNIGGSTPRLVEGYNYQEPGNTTYTNLFRYKYNNGLTVEVFHVGGATDVTARGRRGVSRLGNFSNQTNAAGSAQIGYIGGLGSIDPNYKHSHIQFRRNGKMVDPRSIFCP